MFVKLFVKIGLFAKYLILPALILAWFGLVDLVVPVLAFLWWSSAQMLEENALLRRLYIAWKTAAQLASPDQCEKLAATALQEVYRQEERAAEEHAKRWWLAPLLNGVRRTWGFLTFEGLCRDKTMPRFLAGLLVPLAVYGVVSYAVVMGTVEALTEKPPSMVTSGKVFDFPVDYSKSVDELTALFSDSGLPDVVKNSDSLSNPLTGQQTAIGYLIDPRMEFNRRFFRVATMRELVYFQKAFPEAQRWARIGVEMTQPLVFTSDPDGNPVVMFQDRRMYPGDKINMRFWDVFVLGWKSQPREPDIWHHIDDVKSSTSSIDRVLIVWNGKKP